MELKRDKGKREGAMLQIWLMLLVMGIVLASGFFLIPKTEEERQQMMSFLGTTNTGEIITPVADFSSLAPALLSTKPKWKILVIDPEACLDICEQMIYDMRQVHMLLGRSTLRVERYLLTDISKTPEQMIEKIEGINPFLSILSVNPQELENILSKTSGFWDMKTPRYFLLNPEWQAVLFYTADHDPNGLLDDVKHLLKYSPMR